jgi:cell division protein FtsQ
MLSASDLRKRPMARPEHGARLARWRAQLSKLSPRQVLPVVLAGVGTLLLAWLARGYLDRPIAKLDVEGEFQRVAVGQVEAVVKEFRGKGFVSVDLEAVRSALEAIAWVDHARVARRWPDGLVVTLTEHVPAARWGEHGLLNTRGELFLRDAQQVPLELPQLAGPQDTQQQVTRMYFELAAQLLQVGLRLARVELDARGAWQLELTNGVQIRLGRQDVRARLERLVHSAGALLASQGGAIRYIDMRYSNGFSVGWNAAARLAQGTGAAISDG